MSKRTFMNLLVGSIVLMLCVVMTRSYAGENVSGSKSKTQGLEKTTTNDIYRNFLINNLFNYYSNCGDGSVNPNTGQSGFEFPKGTRQVLHVRGWNRLGRFPQRSGNSKSRWIDV